MFEVRGARRRAALALAGLALAGGVAACGSSSDDGGDKGGAPAADGGGGARGKRIVLINSASAGDFFNPLEKGMNDAAARYGAEVEYMAPDTPEPAKQIQLIKSAISSGADALAIDATAADAIRPLIERAVKDGIPVVTYTSQVEGLEGILGHFGPDDAAEGRQWADAMAEHAGPGGEIAVIEGIPGHPQLSKRIDAMKQQLRDEHPDVKLVGSFAGSFDVAKQAALAESLLKKYPNLKVLGGQEFVSSEAIANVLSRKGLQDKIAGVTFDLNPATIRAVQDGSLKWLTGEDLYHEGFDATSALAAFLEDGTRPAQAVNNTDKCYPDARLCEESNGIYVVDADNVAEFAAPAYLDAYEK